MHLARLPNRHRRHRSYGRGREVAGSVLSRITCQTSLAPRPILVEIRFGEVNRAGRAELPNATPRLVAEFVRERIEVSGLQLRSFERTATSLHRGNRTDSLAVFNMR